MLKLAQVKARQLADLFKTVYKRVTVYKELTGGFGNVKIVFKEALNGHQRFAVKRLEALLLEYLLQEHLAKRGGQLIDQTADTKILVIDDAPFIQVKIMIT